MFRRLIGNVYLSPFAEKNYSLYHASLLNKSDIDSTHAFCHLCISNKRKSERTLTMMKFLNLLKTSL